MKKILVSVTGLVCFLMLAVIIYVAWPWMLLITGINSQPNPPQPSITYGEFPFRLEYELNGKRMIIEDTLICEYDGIGANEGVGKYRKWKQRLASGNANGDFVILEEISKFEKIGFYPGSAEYYMNDSKWHRENNSSFPNAWILEEGNVTGDSFLEEDELLEKYHIKLISWEPSPPIENSFIDNKK